MTVVTYLPDVNLLFAAHRGAHERHLDAIAWLRAVDSFATCPTTEKGLLRLLSNPIANPGVSMAMAFEALIRVRARRQHVFWADDSSLAAAVIDTSVLTGSTQVTDVHLVNLAASKAGILVTFDTRITAALAARDQCHVKVL